MSNYSHERLQRGVGAEAIDYCKESCVTICTAKPGITRRSRQWMKRVKDNLEKCKGKLIVTNLRLISEELFARNCPRWIAEASSTLARSSLHVSTPQRPNSKSKIEACPLSMSNTALNWTAGSTSAPFILQSEGCATIGAVRCAGHAPQRLLPLLHIALTSILSPHRLLLSSSSLSLRTYTRR
jgi:hypothetical protein